MKPIADWTRKEFLALPSIKFGTDVGKLGGLVLVPTRRRHQSGARNMIVIAIGQDFVPTGKFSEWTDIVAITANSRHTMVLLKESGCIFLTNKDHKFNIGLALETMEVFYDNK